LHALFCGVVCLTRTAEAPLPSEFYEGGILIGRQGGYFEHLAHENTAKSRAILVEARQEADALGLDKELFDEFVVGSGLEREREPPGSGP
jgi:hypothetical protein